MEKFNKKNLSMALTDEDRERINGIFFEKGIPYDENMAGIQIFRKILDVSFDNAKPREILPEATAKKLEILEAENAELKKVLDTRQESIDELTSKINIIVTDKLPESAIVCKFDEADRKKLIDLFDYCHYKEGVKSIEEMFCIMLNVLQKGNFFVLDAEDYKFLEEKRNENKQQPNN